MKNNFASINNNIDVYEKFSKFNPEKLNENFETTDEEIIAPEEEIIAPDEEIMPDQEISEDVQEISEDVQEISEDVQVNAVNEEKVTGGGFTINNIIVMLIVLYLLSVMIKF